MRNIASFENKLIEIEEAEEDLILYGSAWVAGVEFLKENPADMKKLADLKEHYKKKIDEILNTKITVQECERYIRLYLEAEEAVLKGQEYTIDGQNLKRADLEQIRKGRIWWENKKAQIESGTGEGIRFFQIVPHEF
ncbi:DUF6148 family protein [Fusobacterium animalis]|jgi:hypothetical protein|uniref:DUF6148 family protein n=1 Tax=Fusobacterium animalis TaxID=76859 RepID=UPI0020490AEE|nr:MAG TPA: head to tail adaptor [Caudoviricetes sp.]